MPALPEAIARRLAVRFAPEFGQHLPELTERVLAAEREEETTFRSIDPSLVLSYASFLVSVSSLAWTIYKDMRQKETAAADAAFIEGVILERLRQEASAPPALAESARERLLEAAVTELLDQEQRSEKR